jgi:transposase
LEQGSCLHSHSQCWWRIEILASLYFILYYQPHQLQQCDNANCCRFKRRGRKSLLIDRPEITVWRAKFLREIEKFRSEERKIFYLDETWINEGHTKTKIWVDESIKSARQAFIEGFSTGLKDPCGKGKRLIILHIGSDEGFVDGGLLIFEGSKGGDYHQEMNATVFETWFAKILKTLPNNAVIVLDNASYHSRKVEKIPTTSWRKGDIQNWLASKNMAFESAMLKAELLMLVKQHKHKFERYAVDELAVQEGKTVLRLPPYHCELNPIELIWAQIKNEVASKNITFKLRDVKPLFQEAVEHVTDENWKKCIEHSKKIENEMRRIGENFGTVPELIISLQDSSSDTSTESDSDKENFD